MGFVPAIGKNEDLLKNDTLLAAKNNIRYLKGIKSRRAKDIPPSVALSYESYVKFLEKRTIDDNEVKQIVPKLKKFAILL